MKRRRLPRPSLVMLPNGFTLANLFFGIFAIVAASRGQHAQAGWYIVIGGFADALDGRIARATNTGSAFGEELDSLVDAISFGVAPAMMMYFAVLRHSGWDWILVFLFTACAVMRLARFNVESAGQPKAAYFTGLPSPAAGGTLATYYWFSPIRRGRSSASARCTARSGSSCSSPPSSRSSCCRSSSSSPSAWRTC